MDYVKDIAKQMQLAAALSSIVGRLNAEMVICEAPIAGDIDIPPKPRKASKAELFPHRRINVRYLAAAGGVKPDWMGL